MFFTISLLIFTIISYVLYNKYMYNKKIKNFYNYFFLNKNKAISFLKNEKIERYSFDKKMIMLDNLIKIQQSPYILSKNESNIIENLKNKLTSRVS